MEIYLGTRMGSWRMIINDKPEGFDVCTMKRDEMYKILSVDRKVPSC